MNYIDHLCYQEQMNRPNRKAIFDFANERNGMKKTNKKFWDERYKARGEETVTRKAYKGSGEGDTLFGSEINKALASISEEYGPVKAIEVGCGIGRWCELIESKGYDYKGVDICEYPINIAKEKYGAGKFRQIKPGKIGGRQNMYDLAMTVTVLQHLSDPDCEKLIDEMKRVVKKGGYILVVENVTKAPDSGHMRFRERDYYTAIIGGEVVYEAEFAEFDETIGVYLMRVL